MALVDEWSENMETTEHHNLIVVSMVHGIAGHFPLRVTCWVLSAILANIGFVLIGRPDFFHEQPVYMFMARVGPPEWWGDVCLILGSSRIVALVINGSFPWFHWSAHIRSFLAAGCCLIWFQLSLGFLTTPLSGLGVAVYPFLMLLEIYNALTAAQEAASDTNKHIISRTEDQSMERLQVARVKHNRKR